MRKVLLTSGQVSILASAFIEGEIPVVLCTLALFLSGYAIQQRTLRELRIAIRPRESPKINLPDRFKTTTTELGDGTIIFLESEAERAIKEQQQLVEVKPTEPETETPKEPEPEVEKVQEPTSNSKATKKQLEMLEQIKAQVAEKSWAVENPDPLSKNKAPLSRAQRRKMIKDEIQRLSQDDRPVYYQRRLW
ncbi:hypothetical protein PT974_09449 [Cladobotryum mycophilum]|uniref:Uncharacterized protein n=1 Tax=Cladobotryum mycophilum TaxID=491253 RepID=A0ABR0SH71_9HYPO